MFNKSDITRNECMLVGGQAKCGYDWWWHSFTGRHEKTGEETEVEDYDWEAITKAVKSFVEDYNDVIEKSGESNSKDVLRNAVWLTGITESNKNVLSKIGISERVIRWSLMKKHLRKPKLVH